jgi:antitoxin HicB
MATKLDYPFQIRSLTEEEGGGYLIEFPDLTGCMSDGVPPPSRPSDETYSGRWNMRVPKSLHRRPAERAKAEGVSVNTLAVTLLAEGLGRRGRDDDRRAA